MEAAIQPGEGIWREASLWTACAFAVRLAFYLVTPQVIDSADSILYLDAAENISKGTLIAVYPRIPLLYPALVAGAAQCISETETAAVLLSLMAGTLLTPVVFLLSNVLHGRNSARLSALTVTLWPWLIDYSTRVAPEALYALCWFLSVLLLIMAMRKGGAYQYMLAVCLVALYLSRPEGILIVIAVLLTGLVFGTSWKLAALRLLPSVSLLAVVVPAHLLLIHKLSTITGIPPRFSVSSVEYSLMMRGGESLRAGALLLFRTLPVMIGPVLGLLAAIGVIARGPYPRDSQAESAVAWAALAQFAAAALSTFPEPRYVMACVIAIGLWSGRGGAMLAHLAGASARWRLLRVTPAIAIVLMMMLGLAQNILPPMLGRMSYKPLEYKIAGQWMKANLTPGLIMSRKPQVGYYAHMPTSGPAPEDTLEDIRERIIGAGMRYVVVDERYSTKMIPALVPLLDPSRAPRWLRLLKSDLSPYPDARVLIYEVEKGALAP